MHGGGAGVMYFDVYDRDLVCFWKPLKGRARPLAVYNMEEAARKAAEKAAALKAVTTKAVELKRDDGQRGNGRGDKATEAQGAGTGFVPTGTVKVGEGQR